MSAAPTTSSTAADSVRLYGGWRLQRGIGLWGLDATSTAVVLLCALTPLLVAALSPQAAAIALLPAAATAGVVAINVEGIPLGVHVRRGLRWRRAVRRGRRSRRYGPNDPSAVRRWPAPLSGMDLLESTGSRQVTFGVVHDRDRGLLTASLRCAASSAWLVESDQADGWVGAWHQWLASLGYVPAVRWVSVVVSTAPDSGSALREAVGARVDARAPADARTLLKQLVDRSPAASAHVSTWVSITFDTSRLRGQRRRSDHDLEAELAEVDRLLTGLETSLATCGVTVIGRASTDDVLDVVADAFDPASGGRRPTTVPATRRSPARDRSWDDAAPVAVEEAWDALQHDSGHSVSWGWREAPRQQVTSDVLSRLHSPGRYPKRVAVLYRPMPAADAARQLESEVNAAAFRDAYRRAQRRDETARDVADREQARRAAREEAMGAGVVLVSIYVTTTVRDAASLPDAVADVEARADQAKIRLRRLYGGQAVGFATTLPLGVHPAGHSGGAGHDGGKR